MKLPKTFMLVDSEVPRLFELATGRKYSDKEPCVNDLRRFFDVCVLHSIGKMWSKNEKT